MSASDAMKRMKALIPGRLLVALVVFACAPLVTAQDAEAANYYVDGSCANNGNGLADQCASSAGGAGAFRDPQSCFSAVRAGDTCFIKNGTYVTNNQGSDTRVNGGFHPMASGTATSKITIRNYPGHRPVLMNCTDYAQRECGHQTISANNQGYIIYDGLTIVGAFYLLNSSMNNRPIEIRNCEVTVGWYGDGNWSGIYLENWNGNWIHHNYIHDLRQSPGAMAGGAAIKLYTSVNSIVEYNTVDSLGNCANCQGIDDKQDSVNNHHRYNHFRNIPYQAGVRINNQNAHFPASSGTQIYGNVFHNTSGGVHLLLNISDITIYNNTFYNVDYGTGAVQGSVRGARVFNNITNVVTNINTNWFLAAPVLSNFNVFQSGPAYRNASSVYGSLSAYQGATGLDGGSRAVDCQFENAAGGDLRLRSTSPCRGVGRTGGTASGTPVDAGAYGIISCVGHTCGGGTTPPPPPPVAPRAPMNVRIIRN